MLKNIIHIFDSLDSHKSQKKITNFPWTGLYYLLFFVTLVIICCTFTDYGITWDEVERRINGDNTILWYTSFFEDAWAILPTRSSYNGCFFDTVSQIPSNIAVLLTGSNLFETRHLCNALFGLLGLITVYRLGNLLSGPMCGFLAALILIITPRYYGHMFNNPKDIPFAVLYLLSIYYIIKTYKELPGLSRGQVIKLGLVIGLTMGMRVGGILLLIYLGLFMLCREAFRYYDTHDLNLLRKNIFHSILPFSFVFLIAWVIMLIFWPWAQVSPILRPLETLFISTKFPEYTGLIFYNGQFINPTILPWHYLFTWFSITLPEFYFILIPAGCFLALFFLWNHKKGAVKQKLTMQVGILIFAILFPGSVAILKKAVVYDGIRHFLFFIPILAVLCALSIVNLITKKNKALIIPLLLLPSLTSMSITFIDMTRLHPYQSIYFNRLIGGGLYQASKKFETDYWGNCFKEGTEWLSKHYKTKSEHKIKVAVELFRVPIIKYYLDENSFITEEMDKIKQMFYLENKVTHPASANSDKNDRFDIVYISDNWDVIFAYTRLNSHLRVKFGSIIHTVTVDNTPLLYIIERNDAPVRWPH